MRFARFLTAILAAAILTAPLAAQAAPAAPGSPAAATTPSPKAAPTDRGRKMRKVLSRMTLSSDEQGKVDQIMAGPLKGRARRNAVRAALTPANQTQFDTLWAAAHARKKKNGGTAPAASGSPASRQ